ncbi:maltose phosphorylase [Rhizomicrobium palustre]|uniref:Maltose phosphorylase n=1 Tax=Rhizomicrobium palustre TaxID=189966 RepID=A0A846MZL5_9PROT|nr:family 65 glycosyl hydrolase domain-containing protein [Rhizomicrobium palustre]NIK88377.1 maltose phosphorylase [Rhizomicrobium palustre]
MSSIVNEWSIIEEGFDPERHEASESLFSIGNGHMGQRANFEERYSGPSLQGSYIAGIYYPDKTRVGWWKNGYPEYFAKVLNAPNWIGIDVVVNGHALDLATCKVEDFRRVLDMKRGVLTRDFIATMADGARLKIEALRFVSMARREVGVVRYRATALSDLSLHLRPYLDGDVTNRDSNYNEKFWNIQETGAEAGKAFLVAQTRKLDFRVGFAMALQITAKGEIASSAAAGATMADNVFVLHLKAGESVELVKYVGVVTSEDHPKNTLRAKAEKAAQAAMAAGVSTLFAEHEAKWADIWNHSDIVVEGDAAAQQGIRFNIFHLNQTYTGEDERLNIGPKGFTGEKYGGSTYWDTEAFCIPFYICAAPARVTRNLLIYRYKHLEKAIENAAKLGFKDGAALYPMVTMNGEECHNEWEITFEEIHRNGAIAYAIFNYIQHTGDEAYLAEYGLEVLIGIARFWAQRATFSSDKGKYVILGVTGPNEYENNVNNNWYTNTIASWCLDYAREAIGIVGHIAPDRLGEIITKTKLDRAQELAHWEAVAKGMHYPVDPRSGLFLQQDGYLDKEQVTVADLDSQERPINQHWSWDRILRSPFIKQADLLMGFYLFEDRFDAEAHRRHFDYYEARTVHESSLSPCTHAVLAARLGLMEKAYAMYLRTARLDLDDYNHEVEEGLHITSMAGTWLAIVEGFGGKRIKNGKLSFDPQIPAEWQKYAFRLLYQDQPVEVSVSRDGVEVRYGGPKPLTVAIWGADHVLTPGEPLRLSHADSAGMPRKLA